VGSKYCDLIGTRHYLPKVWGVFDRVGIGVCTGVCVDDWSSDSYSVSTGRAAPAAGLCSLRSHLFKLLSFAVVG